MVGIRDRWASYAPSAYFYGGETPPSRTLEAFLQRNEIGKERASLDKWQDRQVVVLVDNRLGMLEPISDMGERVSKWCVLKQLVFRICDLLQMQKQGFDLYLAHPLTEWGFSYTYPYVADLSRLHGYLKELPSQDGSLSSRLEEVLRESERKLEGDRLTLYLWLGDLSRKESEKIEGWLTRITPSLREKVLLKIGLLSSDSSAMRRCDRIRQRFVETVEVCYPYHVSYAIPRRHSFSEYLEGVLLNREIPSIIEAEGAGCLIS